MKHAGASFIALVLVAGCVSSHGSERGSSPPGADPQTEPMPEPGPSAPGRAPGGEPERDPDGARVPESPSQQNEPPVYGPKEELEDSTRARQPAER